MAAVDAVRSRDDGPAQEPPTLAHREELAARLRQLGVAGELVLFRSGCPEEQVELPSLERTEAGGACLPQGTRSPDGRLAARCIDRGIEVSFVATRAVLGLMPGCAPAWRPDGMLTAAHEDAIVGYTMCAEPEPCSRTLIPRSELERAARRHPAVPDRSNRLRALVDGVVWLSLSRAAVLLSIRLGRVAGPGALSEIAFFENGWLEKTPGYFRTTGGLLGASPQGTYVTMTPDVILRGDGSQVSLPQHLRQTHDYAWSPDERFVAVATRFAVTVVDVASLERFDDNLFAVRSVTVPVSAAQLEWR